MYVNVCACVYVCCFVYKCHMISQSVNQIDDDILFSYSLLFAILYGLEWYASSFSLLDFPVCRILFFLGLFVLEIAFILLNKKKVMISIKLMK